MSTYEPGSTLADIAATEELGAVEDSDTDERKRRERMDKEMYEEQTSWAAQCVEMRVDDTHDRRTKAGQIADEYKDMSSSEVWNAAHQYYLAQRRVDDRRPDGDLYMEFYLGVYPQQLDDYRSKRRQEEAEVSDGQVLDEFLEGKDLEKL
jgi:hypothetical protein